MHFENELRFWNLLQSFLMENNELETYKPIIAYPKLHTKVQLMIDTNSSKLRKENCSIFSREEKQTIQQLTKSEQLKVYLVLYRLFFLAQMFHNYLVLKNSLMKKLS